MRTTRVFIILSLTTTPSRVFVSDTVLSLALRAGELALTKDGLRPGQVAARLADARGVLRDAHRQLESQVEELLAQLLDFLLELFAGHLAPLFRLHGLCVLGGSDRRSLWSARLVTGGAQPAGVLRLALHPSPPHRSAARRLRWADISALWLPLPCGTTAPACGTRTWS